ncbi:MAG: DNA repair protein RecO [Planctomycetes bacterium]|nr:DNA repair protein RecO [Planctomycetota bacterium]
MILKKDKALCLRAIDYSETSQIVTFFARDTGKIAAIAKGTKRPKSSFGSPVEILSFGDIVFSQNTRDTLATLTEFNQLPAFGSLRKNLFILNSALLTAELLNTFLHEADKHPQLFDSLVEFLGNIQNSQSRLDALSLLILFQLTLLGRTGILPVFQFCLNCKTAVNDNRQLYYFSSSANGLICRDCQMSFPDRIVLDPNAAKCLSDFNHIKQAELETLEKIERLLIYHFTEISGKRLKMAKSILS